MTSQRPKKPSLLSHIRSLLSGKKPKAPKLTQPGWAPGHRGVAAGSWAERERRLAETGEMFTEAERQAWEHLTEEDVHAFLREARPITVHSSNVLWIQYLADRHKLVIGFKAKKGRGGGIYEYDQITEQEALHFIKTGSKGIAVWSVLRRRGSKTEHQKPFRRVG